MSKGTVKWFNDAEKWTNTSLPPSSGVIVAVSPWRR